MATLPPQEEFRCEGNGCNIVITQQQYEKVKKVLGKGMCPDCARKESAESMDAAMTPRDRVVAWLARNNFEEQRTVKGFFILDGATKIAVDMNKPSDVFPGAPVIGRLEVNGDVTEEGHGVARIDDVRQTIMGLLKSKSAGKNGKKEAPAPDIERAKIARGEPKEAEVVDSADKAIQKAGPYVKPDAVLPARAHTPQGSIIKGFVPALKEIGKIKIGQKGEVTTSSKGNQFRPPQKFDHFEIMSLMRDEKGDFIHDPIMSILGEKPKELDVLLLYNDPTLNFSTRYAAYRGGKCLCQGDGQTGKTMEGDTIVCNPDACEMFQERGCKPNGILSVILTRSPRLGGVYKFRTTSYNSIRSILSSMFYLASLTGGVLANIPLKLTVSPMMVQPKDSQTVQTIYVVNLEFAGTHPELFARAVEVAKFQSEMREQIKKLEATARLALSAPESEEEIKEAEAEFYPENFKEVKQ